MRATIIIKNNNSNIKTERWGVEETFFCLTFIYHWDQTEIIQGIQQISTKDNIHEWVGEVNDYEFCK